MRLHLAFRTIYEHVEDAAKLNEFIYVFPRQRGIGKTNALIKFAKENGYIVLVGSVELAKIYSKDYGYDLVKSCRSVLDGYPPVVIDDSVDDKQLDKIINDGLTIITGFRYLYPLKKDRW